MASENHDNHLPSAVSRGGTGAESTPANTSDSKYAQNIAGTRGGEKVNDVMANESILDKLSRTSNTGLGKDTAAKSVTLGERFGDQFSPGGSGSSSGGPPGDKSLLGKAADALTGLRDNVKGRNETLKGSNLDVKRAAMDMADSQRGGKLGASNDTVMGGSLGDRMKDSVKGAGESVGGAVDAAKQSAAGLLPSGSGMGFDGKVMKGQQHGMAKDFLGEYGKEMRSELGE